MQWSDEAVILSTRAHGETSAIVTVLAREHGRSSGLVKGARSRRLRPMIQQGNLVSVQWRARLSEHLGNFDIELRTSFAARAMGNKATLAALLTMTFFSETLPERDPHPVLFDAMLDVLTRLDGSDWLSSYVTFEAVLLRELGAGLDLDECAVTGRHDQLIYISPRSGRAVSAEAGEAYKDRLLPLPAFLLEDRGPRNQEEVADGLQVSGHFLGKYAAEMLQRPLPALRSEITRLAGLR